MSLNQILHTFDDEKEIVKVANKYVEKGKDVIDLRGVLQRKRLKRAKESTAIKRGVSFAPHAATYPFCRRLKIGQLAGFVNIYYDKPTPRTQTGFDLGTQLHDLVQSYFWEVGMLKGTFECLKCDKLYHDQVSPITCPSGKVTHIKKHLRYREVKAQNEEFSLYGRSDGILVMEKDEELLEIKSLPAKPFKNPNNFQFYFDDLEEQGPRENHIIQLTLYMLMLKIYKGHLFYISKNDGQIKTYAIEYDQERIQPFLNEIGYLKEQAALLKQGEKIDLPPCCDSDTCPCHSIISPMFVS